MRFLGWETPQWSVAKDYYDRLNPGADVPATLAGAMTVRHFWKSRRLDEPGESGLLVPEHCTPQLPADWLVRIFSLPMGY